MKRPFETLWGLLFIAAGFLTLAGPASAATMHYTLTGTVTGSLESEALFSRPFIIEMETPFTALWSGGPSSYAVTFFGNPASYTTITLGGIGTALLGRRRTITA